MWYYLSKRANPQLTAAARRHGETVTVQEEPPEQAELILLDREDVPHGLAGDNCIAIDRREPIGLANWAYAVESPYDADDVIRVGQCLCGRRTDAMMQKLTESCLTALSVPGHLLGYRYLCESVQQVNRAKNAYALSMTKDIYPAVGRAFDSSPIMASRAMRHAIERAWRYGDRDVQRSYFGYAASDKRGMPTNMEFVYAVRERTRLLGGGQNFVRERPNTAQR